MLKCFFVFTIALAAGVLALETSAAQPGKKSSSIESARSAGAGSDIDTVLLKNRASVTGKILAEITQGKMGGDEHDRIAPERMKATIY